MTKAEILLYILKDQEIPEFIFETMAQECPSDYHLQDLKCCTDRVKSSHKGLCLRCWMEEAAEEVEP